jgi:hypothetical protein
MKINRFISVSRTKFTFEKFMTVIEAFNPIVSERKEIFCIVMPSLHVVHTNNA